MASILHGSDLNCLVIHQLCWRLNHRDDHRFCMAWFCMAPDSVWLRSELSSKEPTRLGIELQWLITLDLNCLVMNQLCWGLNCRDGHWFCTAPILYGSLTMACFLLLPSRSGGDRKGGAQFWFYQGYYPSWLVSLLIPISADRVDLLFCNANSISDQIATGYPLADVCLGKSTLIWQAMLAVGETVAPIPWQWVGSACSRFWLGLTTRCSWDESVQLGLLLLSLTVTVHHCLTNRCFMLASLHSELGSCS